MNATQKPEALALAQEYRVTMPESVLHLWAADARDTMRRQHARIAELETQLSAIGAGGVEPLTDEALDAMRQADNGQLNFVTLRQFRIIARAVERAHGIHPDAP